METTLTNAQKALRITEYQRHANGFENSYRHLFGLVYSEGFKLLAETCGAYWLIDILASYQPRLKGEEFQLWILTAPEAEGKPWVIEAWTDTPPKNPAKPRSFDGKRLVRQEIEYSDFPVELAGPNGFQFYVEYGTAFFKEER